MTIRFALVITAILALVLGCTSDDEPELPSTDAPAVADRITGSDGQAFLREITTARWDDDGRGAAALFAWIPRDAPSTDQASADRAGKTAHAIASFLADNRASFATAPSNPALWQAFAQSLVPYVGAMVGDESGVVGFEPLDGSRSPMQHTVAVFAAMTKNADADRIVTDGATARVHTYETAFAKAALAEPLSADRDAAQRALLLAARLRSLIDAGAYLANPDSPRPSPRHAQTEVAYQVVSLTARPDDPYIDERFFRDGRLLSPSEIPEEDWSIYDAQLSAFLTTSPQVLNAIDQFGHAYDVITPGQ
jgi:hypothetical protein